MTERKKKFNNDLIEDLRNKIKLEDYGVENVKIKICA